MIQYCLHSPPIFCDQYHQWFYILFYGFRENVPVLLFRSDLYDDRKYNSTKKITIRSSHFYENSFGTPNKVLSEDDDTFYGLTKRQAVDVDSNEDDDDPTDYSSKEKPIEPIK